MHKEINFEDDIQQALITHGGYTIGNPNDYDPDRALFPPDLLHFIQTTQPQIWQRLTQANPTQAQTILLDSLTKELHSKGALSILRQGFKCFGKTIRLAYFAPEALTRYQQNRLTLTRQVRTRTGAIPDIILSLNGLPIVCIELKNPMSGQTVTDTRHQYQSREPKEPLFSFKERCLVFFGVDTDAVIMTTKLEGPATTFLPFDRGHHHGAGNPPIDNDVRTSYLWNEVLQRDSLLDILARFLHLSIKETTLLTTKGPQLHRQESLIFPRYHQLTVVRHLTHHAQTHSAGHNYLIQHSAGSGKSNSIAWLAHRLSSLHDSTDTKIFHAVIVITDRRVLDQQLQDTIYQFEHKAGVVQKIDQNTQQLAKALADGTPIIISTVQKFPFITQAIDTLAKQGQTIAIDTQNKRFAVIIDEAHSSQGGETAMELRKILNKDGIEAAIAEQILDLEEEDLSDQAKANLIREQLKRTKQPNISFFAFTATPKYKTKLVFDEPGEDGTSPFHLYSMRQAIEEGFILDVLENYICYQRYYELIETAAHDPEVPRRQAARALARFIDLHEYNIRQKVEIIIEHFRAHTRHKIGGRAKAMVVTSSREHAVRYKLEFDKYLKTKGYTDIKSLVAFSGEVHLKEFPDTKFTEVGMNKGIQEKELRNQFDTDEYQVLLVAEKYQTGFDQPLLHTMYVDKRLANIQAVQTLSRLNRTAPGKTDTFVLDFVNSPEDIYEAFKPYYETTPIADTSDPQQLNDLSHRLSQWRIFETTDINAWCEIWFRNRMNPTGGEHKKLNSIIDRCVETYKTLTDEDQALFKSQLASFRNLYLFLSQIIPYQDSELEKLFTFGRYLLTKLPSIDDNKRIKIDDDVQLKYYRLEKISEGKIDLRAGEASGLYGPTEVGTGQADELVPLSNLVDRLNERFGTDFTLADQLFFDQIRETAIANDQLRQAATVNTLENFRPVFMNLLDSLFIERMEGNEEITMQVVSPGDFREMVAELLLQIIYKQLQPDN
jgi:type I restriction enzyme, R subunit